MTASAMAIFNELVDGVLPSEVTIRSNGEVESVIFAQAEYGD